jgi:hypothetical protein
VLGLCLLPKWLHNLALSAVICDSWMSLLDSVICTGVLAGGPVKVFDASASALRITLAFANALALAFAEEHRNHQPMRAPFQLHRAENGNCRTSHLMPS